MRAFFIIKVSRESTNHKPEYIVCWDVTACKWGAGRNVSKERADCIIREPKLWYLATKTRVDSYQYSRNRIDA